MSDTQRTARQAREAALRLAAAGGEARDGALRAVAGELSRRREEIFAANERDLERGVREGLAAPLRKRLQFGQKKLDEVLSGIDSLRSLPDPLGRTTLATELAPGLNLYRVTCPIGVIGVIFESRPDALAQIAALCLKSGNAVLLKGGSEARLTNRALFDAIAAGAAAAGMPGGWAGLLESRAEVAVMLKMDGDIDLIIPRGSKEFVRHIMTESRIPVMGHADGLCHTYVDAAADCAMAVRVAVDGKAQYAAVCNATETLLCHKDIAGKFLPPMKTAMEEAGVALRGCVRTREIINVEPADDADWDTEYLDYILSVRVVDSLDEAIAHINRHGSGHTDAIVTGDRDAAARFLAEVDSAGVFVNCSTRFSDGYRYGFGAEVGISTNKIHARGPVGLEGLLIYKYKLLGGGQIVADFASGKERFTHRALGENCPL